VDASLFVADALEGRDWDVIHLAENDGLAAASLLLRCSGLAFQSTQFVVTAHGPTRWHRIGNLLHWSEREGLGSQLETYSIELADAFVCPSQYIADWCRQRYVTQAPPLVIPNSLTGEGRCFGRGPREPRRIEKVVFFGRIELRKGIDRFIAAVDRLLAQGHSDFEVVFLGSFVSYYPRKTLEQQTSHWTCRTTILPDYTSHEAQELLRTERCIAVMPSRLDNSPYTVLECLDNAVPFVATDVGGVAELVHPDDRARVLASGDPQDVAEKIAEALRNGAAPARPSFDPARADIDLLALHANLVAKARDSRGPAARERLPETTLIVHGPKAESMAPALAEWLGRVGGASIELLVSESPGADPSATNGRTLNAAARKAAHDHLLFCHTTTLPDHEALNALLAALVRTDADAAVCGYRFRRTDGSTGEIAAFAGPPELSAKRNVYGARLLLVRKTALVAAGGFSDQPDIAAIIEWELLNRLKAAGRTIAAVPIPLASTVGMVALDRLSESQQGALALPWAEAAPAELQGIVRMALHSTASRQPAPRPSFHRDPAKDEDEPAETALFRGVDPWDDTLNRDGRLRIGSDGALRDASETYRIDADADASDCDFLVADDLVATDTASLLADAYKDAERHLLCADNAAPAGSSFLWLREIEPTRPDAVGPILEIVEDALARISAFYELDATLHPEDVRLRRIGAGGALIPPRRVAPHTAYPDPGKPPGFSGQIVIGAECEGGGLYFTGLDMEVAPRRGRLVGTMDAPYHEHAILKVTSGELLLLSFAMRTEP
jgi:glycosyltransferase involved in cell wall biosynthesis